ncbi:MAG: n-acetylglutamate synthase, partial [Saprospiraceae bacterium]
SENGEVDTTTVFEYFQEENIFSGEYSGGNIIKGNIIGRVNSDNSLTFSYQHIDPKGEILTGKCNSRPEIMPNGKIRLHEKWQWTCRDFSEGYSIIEEI